MHLDTATVLFNQAPPLRPLLKVLELFSGLHFHQCSEPALNTGAESSSGTKAEERGGGGGQGGRGPDRKSGGTKTKSTISMRMGWAEATFPQIQTRQCAAGGVDET